MQESTNSQSESLPSESPDGGESREASASQIEEIAALLREPNPATEAEASSEGEANSEKPGESQDGGKPKTINDLAKQLGVDVKELYSLEFKMAETGESRTLGQLKDIAAETDSFEVKRLEFEESKTKRETEFVRAQAELSELINMLPKNAVTPQLLEVLGKKRAQVVERESRLTLTAIPEWNDSDTEQTERKSMREHLSAYGFGESYLDSVSDHKTLKYIRDNMQRQQRIERVLSQVKQVTKPGHKPSAKSSTPTGRKTPSRRGPRNQTQQVQAVAKLLTGTTD